RPTWRRCESRRPAGASSAGPSRSRPWRTAPASGPRRRCGAPSPAGWASRPPNTAPASGGSPSRWAEARRGGTHMQVACLLYDRFTALDVVGPFEVLNNVPGTEPVFVAERKGPIRNESDTMSIVADRALDEVTSPDIVI